MYSSTSKPCRGVSRSPCQRGRAIASSCTLTVIVRRRVVAQVVADDPFTYNEGFLGKSNEDYQKWIVDPKRWGGAIELSIFAR